jgi:hypothetical protein
MVKYTAADLHVFSVAVTPAACVGSHYFELHPNELATPTSCWLSGSLFVRDAAFDFFADCFHGASETFNYFSFQRFGPTEIDTLKVMLDNYLKNIKFDTARGQLFSRYASVVDSAVWDDIDTKTLTASVYQCGQIMSGFIELHTRRSECLWVLGM